MIPHGQNKGFVFSCGCLRELHGVCAEEGLLGLALARVVAPEEFLPRCLGAGIARDGTCAN